MSVGRGRGGDDVVLERDERDAFLAWLERVREREERGVEETPGSEGDALVVVYSREGEKGVSELGEKRGRSKNNLEEQD